MTRLGLSVAGGLGIAALGWFAAIVVVTLNSVVPVWPFGIVAAVSAAFLWTVDVVTEKRAAKSG